MDTKDKVIQQLDEIHALELALVQTLTAHVAMTPRGDHRNVLERHLGETRRQAERIRSRLRALGAKRSPLALAYGIVQTVAGQGVSAAKAPIDMLRGTSGAEKMLKNAKDEIATEALEIASYDALEALAEQSGDQPTVRLAREHREQEERAMRELRDLIPALTAGLVRESVHGEHVFDTGTTGAADMARMVASKAVDAARSVPGVAAAEGEAKGAVADEDDLPISGYDDLTAAKLLPRIDKLTQVQLGLVDAYERRHRNRKQVLQRIAKRRELATTSS
ncbi:MAG: ferritin-like domain-containing protein [Solirubrobacteraceae bacterium MAG38_C4-C5]|nr:ferritin-like domain-containing protein [Candidatus Siliceabacter maunaloa]